MIQTYHWTPNSGCAILLGMIAQQYQLYVERRDPRRNMARFYALSIEETLFGQSRLVRRWGRIGTIGCVVQHSFDDEGEAVDLFLQLLRAKRMRGYHPRSAAQHADGPIRSTEPRPSRPVSEFDQNVAMARLRRAPADEILAT